MKSDHVRKFCDGVVAWNSWRETNQDIVPDLAGFVLQLSGKRMSSGVPVNLKSAQLQKAALRFAHLSGASLEGADSTGAFFQHACLRGANLEGANLRDVMLDHADLSGANLKEARLRGASLHLTNLESADLKGADLTGADLLHARLSNASLRGADLSSTRLDHADFEGADLTDANLRGASLHHVKNLTRVQLEVARKSQSTILPPYLKEKPSRSARRKPDKRPSISTARKAPVFSGPNFLERHALTAGVVIAALLFLGFLWRESFEVGGLAALESSESTVHRTGTEDSRPTSPLRSLPVEPAISLQEAKFDVPQEISRAGPLNAVRRATVAFPISTTPHELRKVTDIRELTAREIAEVLEGVVDDTQMASEIALYGGKELAGQPTTSVETLSPSLNLLSASRVIPRLSTIKRPLTMVNLKFDARPLSAPPLEGLAHVEIGPPLVVDASFDPIHVLTPHASATPLEGVIEPDSLASSLLTDLIEETKTGGNAIEGVVLSEPLTVVVSLKDQKLNVYRGLQRIDTTRISSGMPGYETLTGVFGILQKKREHYSNLYDDAPMPWMQRLTRSGTALHAGPVPNYPASHGCVRMPDSFAPKLFRMTEVGGKVAIMTGSMVAPQVIEHQSLPKSQVAEVSVSVTDRVAGGVTETAGVVAGTVPPEAEATGNPDAPLRILVTRREQRDIAVGVQESLAAMGYLEPQDKFVGYLGEGTKKAIMAFEKDHGLRSTGLFTEEIAAKIYEAAGKGPLPDAYLFLRKGFSRVRHVPVKISNLSKNLGTHHFTYTHPTDGSEPQWVGISLEGEDSKSVLDRITIPSDMRMEISKALNSGASFIVADKARHSSILPEGDDFIVRTNDSAESKVVADKKPAKKKVLAKPRKKKATRKATAKRTITRKVTKPRKSRFRLFSRR